MSKHRFQVGDLVRTRVSVSTPIYENLMDVTPSSWPYDLYEVSRILPELANGEPQYRIKSEGEPERVVPESQLAATAHKRPVYGPEKPIERLQAMFGDRRRARRRSVSAG